MRRPLYMFVVSGFALAIGLLYWIFLHDPYPREAVAFLYPLETVEPDDNAIFSIAGLAAPLEVENSRAWGYEKIVANWERRIAGERSIPILSSPEDSSNQAKLEGLDTKNLYCWLPDVRVNRGDCLSKGELKAVIDANRYLLKRYESIFDYPSIDNWPYYGVSLLETLQYTNLYALQFWLNKDNLGGDDYARIFKFFRFWESLALNGSLGSIDVVIPAINYYRASSLIIHLAQSNPSILDQYYLEYGKFTEVSDWQYYIDRVLRRDYHELDDALCFSGHLKVDARCTESRLKFPSKIGATVENMYRNRPEFESCRDTLRNKPEPTKKSDKWRLLLSDPGNLYGNLLLIAVIGPYDLCRLAINAQHLLEANVFRNRHLEFRRKGLIAEDLNQLYQSEPVLFQNQLTGNLLVWDTTSARLVWSNDKYSRRNYLQY